MWYIKYVRPHIVNVPYVNGHYYYSNPQGKESILHAIIVFSVFFFLPKANMAHRLFFTVLFILTILSIPASAEASHGTHLVISEIQTTGGAGLTKNDFVELYNPTGTAIDLNGIRLVKRTATGTTDTTLKSWTETTPIPAHGYYLWANSDFATIATAADAKTIQTIADDNGVALRQGAENTGTIIDAVSWGAGASAFIEGTPFSQNPGPNQSIERKPGGAEGNGTDTGNNANDFALAPAPTPQNSSSTPVPTISIPLPSGPICGNDTCETGESFTSCSSDCAAPTPAPVVVQPGEIVVNEFVPDPLDANEWIELYNTTSRSIDLTGFKILDGTGNSIKTLSGIIGSQSFLSFDLASARLNNSGDRIILQSPGSATIDAISYGDWSDGNTADNAPAPLKSGQSVARASNGLDTGNDKNDFALSDSPTKNASNVITVTTTISVGGTNVSQVPFVRKLQILINEFVSDPEDSPEWVELYNAGNLSVDLEGWYLEDGSEQKTKLSGTIVPENFQVVSDIAGSLGNAGDIIRLKNEKGEVIDRVTFGTWEDGTPSDNAPIASDPNSVARRIDGKDTDNDAADFMVTGKPTKGKANVIEGVATTTRTSHPDPAKAGEGSPAHAGDLASVRDSSSPTAPQNDNRESVTNKLFISEIMPDPEGSDDGEWIELYWDGDVDLPLDGFQIDDADGGSRPHVIDGLMIKPKSFVLLPKSRTHLTLNNDSDNVRLLNQKGVLIDLVEYENAKEGIAYAKADDGNWHWTATSTLAGKNNITEGTNGSDAKGNDAGYIETSLSNLKDLEIGRQVRVQGVVSVVPGILGSQIFYIAGPGSFATEDPRQSRDSGIQIYSSKKSFSKLVLGDTITVQGILSEARGERRIKIQNKDDIDLLRHGSPPITHPTSIDALSEDDLGMLVQINGTILDTIKSGFTLHDDTDEIAVTIKSSTGIDARQLNPGNKVSLTGIVGPTSSGIQILPRFQDDIEITGHDDAIIGPVSKSSSPQNEASPPYTKTTAYAGSAVALSALAIRRRQLFLTGARAIAFLIKRNKNNLG